MLRIGMIGTGRITERFITEYAHCGGFKLTAVYNPRRASAEKFVKEHGLSETRATDRIEELASLVDAVYVASPHEEHEAYTKEMLFLGKHVLCEKPMCISQKAAASLFALAKEKNVVLMEAIKTAYCPGFYGILKLIEDGEIGIVHDVEACFSKLAETNTREIWSEYGGAFVELGTYSLLPILKIYGKEYENIHVQSCISPVGIDSYTKCNFDYEDAFATAKTGIGIKSEGELIVAGSTGYIRVPSPWWLTRHVEIHREDASKTEIFDYPFEAAGLRYEIEEFRKKIERLSQNGLWDSVLGDSMITPEDSIWFAGQMEKVRETICKKRTQKYGKDCGGVNGLRPGIWAHRGCSLAYPENTLSAFLAAAKLPDITGIELDVQLSKDGELVVFHDEKLDRTSTGSGDLKDYTLAELKKFDITGAGKEEPCELENGKGEKIPTLEEVFTVLQPYCLQNGLLINIELKNSRYRYEGMEEKIVAMVAKFGLHDSIIYSSFLPSSMKYIKGLDPMAKTGILAADIHKCIKEMYLNGADAVHPCFRFLDINPEMQEILCGLDKKRIPVRAWGGGEPFYGQEGAILKEKQLDRFVKIGVTDIITNVPENYL